MRFTNEKCPALRLQGIFERINVVHQHSFGAY